MFITAFITWSLLTWVPGWQQLLAGAVISAFVAFMLGDQFIRRVGILAHPNRHWYFLFQYIPLFVWEVIKANLDVAYRVLHPGLPIRPGIVKVKTSLKSDMGLTFLANSITLTPGTMSVDIDKDKGVLYIHWIFTRTQDTGEATKIIVDRFERVLKKIFE